MLTPIDLQGSKIFHWRGSSRSEPKRTNRSATISGALVSGAPVSGARLLKRPCGEKSSGASPSSQPWADSAASPFSRWSMQLLIHLTASPYHCLSIELLS